MKVPFLTRQEKYILVFLLAGAAIGIGYSYLNRFRAPQIRYPAQDTTQFDEMLVEAKSIDINTASLAELMKLKGIGPALASRIIEYRAANGPFSDIKDIQNVKGIGPKKFEEIKGFITAE